MRLITVVFKAHTYIIYRFSVLLYQNWLWCYLLFLVMLNLVRTPRFFKRLCVARIPALKLELLLVKLLPPLRAYLAPALCPEQSDLQVDPK